MITSDEAFVMAADSIMQLAGRYQRKTKDFEPTGDFFPIYDNLADELFELAHELDPSSWRRYIKQRDRW